MPSAPTPANPFMGLEPYEEADQQKLFGRDRDLILMKDRILSGRTTLLFAGSGVGKTSFLKAKVVPEMRKQYCVIWHNKWTGADEKADLPTASKGKQAMRLWPPWSLLSDLIAKVFKREHKGPEESASVEPVKPAKIEDEFSLSIHRTIAQNLRRSSGSPPRPLSHVLARFKKGNRDTAGDQGKQSGEEPAKERCILILDQFEEVFQYHVYEKYFDDLIKDLCEIINNEDYQVRIVFAMREEFLGELSIFDNRIPDIFNNYYRLKYPDKGEARDIITLTSEWAGNPPDEEKVAALVEDLSKFEKGGASFSELANRSHAKVEIVKRNFVAPPYLQIACERLWNEQYPKKQPLPASPVAAPFLANYRAGAESGSKIEQCGDAYRVLTDFCNERLSKLTPDEQDLASRAFEFLVTKQGAKMAYELYSLADHMEEKQVLPLEETLNKLSQRGARILRQSLGRDEAPWYELYHDMYAPIVEGWARKYREEKKSRDRWVAAARGITAAAGLLIILTLPYTVPHWILDPPHYKRTLIEFRENLAGSNFDKAEKYPEATRAFAELRETFGYEGTANSLWADVLARRAQWYASEGNRDSALLSLLKAAALKKESDNLPRNVLRWVGIKGNSDAAPELLRDAELLLGGDYSSLVTTYDSNVSYVARSDNGTVLTRTEDGKVRLWRADSGEPVASLCPKDCDQALFSVDGKFVVTTRTPDSGPDDGTRQDTQSSKPANSNRAADPKATPKDGNPIEIGFWDASTGNLLESVRAPADTGKRGAKAVNSSEPAVNIWSAAQTGSTYLITLAAHQQAEVWSTKDLRDAEASGRPFRPLWTHATGLGLVLNRGGTYLLAQSQTAPSELWQITANKGIVRPPLSIRGGAVFSPDGNKLLAGDGEYLRVWDLARFRELSHMPLPGTEQVRFNFSPDGNQFFSATRELSPETTTGPSREAVQVRNSATAEPLFGQLIFEGLGSATFLGREGKTLLRSPPWVAIGSLQEWNVEQGQLNGAIRGGRNVAMAVVCPEDNSMIITSDEVARRWRVETSEGSAQKVGGEAGFPVAISGDGKTCAAIAKGKIQIWNLDSRTPVGGALANVDPSGNPLSRNGEYFAGVEFGEPKRLTVWKVPSMEVIPLSTGQFRSITFSSDGKFLGAMAGPIGEPRVWSLPDGRELWIDDKAPPTAPAAIGSEPPITPADPANVAMIAMSGDYVLLAGYDGSLSIRDLRTRHVRHKLMSTFSRRTVAAAFSPDGKRLLTGDSEGLIRLWDPAQGTQVGRDIKCDKLMTTVAFSGDGKAAVVFTRAWFYRYGVEDDGLHFLKAGVLTGLEGIDRLSSVDEEGGRIRIVYRSETDYLLVDDIDLEGNILRTLKGDPNALLKAWQIKLGLQINDTGEITPRGESLD